ncbi:Glutamine-dependent NAD(+) synthetase [subsurface metagenome]
MTGIAVLRLGSGFPLQRKFDLNLRFASILGCLNHGLHRYILRSSVLRSAYSAEAAAKAGSCQDNRYNSAAILQDGRISKIYRKSQLPNYGVFDERRYLRIAEKDKLTGILISIWWTGNGRVGIFLFFLAEIAKGWPKLSVELRQAIVKMVW